jgi:hypothetical protein
MSKPASVLIAFAVVMSAASAFAQVPGAPTNLTSAVSGTTVTLTWGAPSVGGVPTGYVVEAAATPGGAVVATLNTAGVSVTVGDVPLGVYYVRVRAANGSGQSAPSNEVVVAVGGAGTGCPAPPLPPVLIVQSVGLQATVSWSSGGGCAPSTYVLYAGSAPGLSDIAVVNMGGSLGLATPAPPGTYYVRVIGTNPSGSAVSEELTVRVAVNAQTDTALPNTAVGVEVLALQTGLYTGTLLWNDATINLDLFLAASGCPYPLPSGCQLAASTSIGVASEQVSRPVIVGQTYRLWVVNSSLRTTSFTVFSNIGGAP